MRHRIGRDHCRQRHLCDAKHCAAGRSARTVPAYAALILTGFRDLLDADDFQSLAALPLVLRRLGDGALCASCRSWYSPPSRDSRVATRHAAALPDWQMLGKPGGFLHGITYLDMT